MPAKTNELDELKMRDREKSVVIEVINLLTGDRPNEEMITRIAEEIARLIPLDALAINVLRDDRFLEAEFYDLRAVRSENTFVPIRRFAFWEQKGLGADELAELIDANNRLLLERAFYNGDDFSRLAASNKLFAKMSEQFGFRSIMFVPVPLQNGGVMTLAANSRKPDAYSEELLERLCETGRQISLAFETRIAFAELTELKNRLQEENSYLAEEVKTTYNFSEIIGTAPALQKVFRQIERVAPTDATILLAGETGTGKELFARAIHALSKRRERSLIKVNCAAVPASLFESELFGHERGAFTGAGERRIGRFELAHHGTLFLDEISELALDSQAKLLRVLQEGEIERLGGRSPVRVDVRVIAATNRDLRNEVAGHNFRQDLLFRLNTIVVHLPALRERREDIPALTIHFAKKFATRIGREVRGISNEMLDALMKYEFPGNVRELEHIVEEAVIFSNGGPLRLHRPLGAAADSSPAAAKVTALKTLAELEREYILEVLSRTGGRIRGEGGAAQILDLKPTTLEARMKRLGIRKTHISAAA